MNYNFISQLLDNGISEDELIASLSKSVPRLAKKAKQMFFGGWKSKDILDLFSKDKEVQSVARKGLKPVTPSEMADYNLRKSYDNIPQGSGQESKQKLGEFTKKAAPYALGAIASPLAGTVIQSALKRALPQTDKLPDNVSNPISGQPQTPNQPIIPSPSGNSNQYDTPQQPPANQVAASIPEPSNITQPEVISNPKEFLEKAGVLGDVDRMLKEKNTPEAIAATLGLKQAKGKPQAKIDPELLKNIEEYAKIPQEQEKISPEIEKPAEPVKIEKNSVVSSPNGIGEVKEIRNGQAIVEVDGKLHKVNEKELQSEPEEVKKSKIEFNLDDVPEDLRSAPLNEVYAPAHRKHVTIKYNSDVGKEKSKRYIFYKKDGSPVDENIIENLRVGSQLPVSNGKTFWGGWSADTQDSRGTVAYHELSKLAQKMGEEDDPSKPYWFEEEEEVFTHGYSKMAEKKLKEEEKKFNEANKKPKKKRA
jgi:hypothetical protein